MNFLMIPLTFLYDEYIDRPKLSEQKKPHYKKKPRKVGSEQQRIAVPATHYSFRTKPKTDDIVIAL